jgi:hypothetical protein
MFYYQEKKLPESYQIKDDGVIEVTYLSLKEFSKTLYAEYDCVQKLYRKLGENVKIILQFTNDGYICSVDYRFGYQENSFSDDLREKFQKQLNIDMKKEIIDTHIYHPLEKLKETREFPFEKNILNWMKMDNYLIIEPFTDFATGDGAVLATYLTEDNRMWFFISNKTGKYGYTVDGTRQGEFDTLDEAYQMFVRKEKAKRLEKLF